MSGSGQGPSLMVVGSVNLDLVANCRSLPTAGETVGAVGFQRSPGGKGANQALAARRLGAEVSLLARVGDDALADEALTLLRGDGVDLGAVAVDADATTGVALITVDESGENTIVVVPGANATLRPDHVTALHADGVLCQFEVPVETVEAAAEACTGLFCLNAAPSTRVPASVLGRADVIVVNESERRAIGSDLDTCPALVVVTLGAAGAVAFKDGEELARARPPAVTVIDAVGAGDAFVAALVVRLLEGAELPDALATGCTAGALATTVRGAQPALPRRAQVDELAATTANRTGSG